MAGANGVAKFAVWDRENHLNTLMYNGPIFHARDIYAPVGMGIVLTGTQMLQDLLFTAATVSPITGPTIADLFNAIRNANGQTIDGYQFSIIIQNTDPVNDKTINFPAGWSPASLTIPANSYGTYTWQLDNIGTSPTVTLVSTVLGSPPGSSGVTSFNGRTGAVVSVAGDYDTDLVDNVSTVPGVTTSDALDLLFNNYNTNTVQSFNGRTGAVVSVAGDYNSTQVTNLSTVPGANVTLALNDLQANKISAPLPATINDALVYDGANWVSTTVNPNIRAQNHIMAMISPFVAGTRITGQFGCDFTGDPAFDDPYIFESTPQIIGLNEGMFQMINQDPSFNQPNAGLLVLDAPNSVTFGGGTNFILCHNGVAGASVAPYANGVVFIVDSHGDVTASVYNTWASSIGMKKDITPLVLDSHVIQTVNPATFRYLADDSLTTPKRAGIMYEEMLPICPEACTISHNNGNKQVELTGVVSSLYAIVKHLEARVTALENE